MIICTPFDGTSPAARSLAGRTRNSQRPLARVTHSGNPTAPGLASRTRLASLQFPARTPVDGKANKPIPPPDGPAKSERETSRRTRRRVDLPTTSSDHVEAQPGNRRRAAIRYPARGASRHSREEKIQQHEKTEYDRNDDAIHTWEHIDSTHQGFRMRHPREGPEEDVCRCRAKTVADGREYHKRQQHTPHSTPQFTPNCRPPRSHKPCPTRYHLTAFRLIWLPT